jgi:hypothetical protein
MSRTFRYENEMGIVRGDTGWAYGLEDTLSASQLL